MAKQQWRRCRVADWFRRRTLLRVDQPKDKKGHPARLQPAGSAPGGITIQRLRRICLPSAQFKVKDAAAQYFCLTRKYFWVIYAFTHVDTVECIKNLIRMKMLCVNNNTLITRYSTFRKKFQYERLRWFQLIVTLIDVRAESVYCLHILLAVVNLFLLCMTAPR